MTGQARRTGLARHATNLLLVVAAIGAGLYVYIDRRNVSDRERKDRAHDVFPAYRRQDIAKVELTQGAARLAFERRPDGDAGDTTWWMTSPREERADASAVDKLLGDVEFAGVLRRVDPGVARGFDAPRLTGKIAMGPLTYAFALGDPAPTPEGAAYFKVEGEGAFVVSRDFVTSLLRGPDAYRERTVVPYLSLDLRRLAVKGPDTEFAIERADDVSFLLSDRRLRASREALDRVWGALAEARAESFLADADADRAIGPAPLTIIMSPRDASRKEGVLAVGGLCPGHPEDVVAIRRAPTRLSACVPKGVMHGLSTTSADLVDERLFAARGDEVAELLLEAVPAGVKIDLARKGSGWHARSPFDRDLSPEEVDAANDLAAAVTKGEATRVTAGDAKDAFQARARVRVQRADDKGDEVVLLGPAAPDGGALVRREADGATLEIPGALARRLTPSVIALRGRTLFVPSLEGKIASRLELRCDGQEQILERGEQGWSFLRPAGYPADGPAVADLVRAVTRAEADAWVADADDGSFGFGGPPCEIALTYPADGGPSRVGVAFGHEAEGGGSFARLIGQPQVFLASRTLRDEPRRLLVDTSGFRVDAASIESVTLARGPLRLALARRGGRLTAADGGAGDLGDKVGLALEALRADAVIHLGPPRATEGLSGSALEVTVKTTAEAGAREVRFRVGDSALILKERMFYARLVGVDATFAIARDRLAPIVDAL